MFGILLTCARKGVIDFPPMVRIFTSSSNTGTPYSSFEAGGGTFSMSPKFSPIVQRGNIGSSDGTNPLKNGGYSVKRPLPLHRPRLPGMQRRKESVEVINSSAISSGVGSP
jgi:hypothetical protein